MEQKLRNLLRRVPRYYEDFELGSVLLVKDNPESMALLIKYLEEHPKATTSEVIHYTLTITDHISEPPEPDED